MNSEISFQTFAEHTDCLEAAIHYRELGFSPVFADGKRPVGKRWQETDPDEHDLRNMFRKGYNVGISIRPFDGKTMVCFDVDSAERVAFLESNLGALPPTLTGRSARGERRFYLLPEEISAESIKNITYLRLPDEPRPTGKVEGVDVKTTGGFVVVAPSMHESGVRYTWTDLRSPSVLPAEWVQVLIAPSESRSKVETKLAGYAAKFSPASWKEHKREFKDARQYIEEQIRNHTWIIANCADGLRNHTLNRSAFIMFSRVYGLKLEGEFLAYVKAQLSGAARATGLEEREIANTIESARKGGFAKARAPHLKVIETTETASDVPEPYDDPEPVARPVKHRPDWVSKLKASKGRHLPDVENVALALAHDPALCGGVRLDRLSRRVYWRNIPESFPPGRGPDRLRFVDSDAVSLGAYLSRAEHYDWDGVARETVADAVELCANRNSYDSLTEYVQNLDSWDGVSRVDKLFTSYLGAEDTEASRILARRWVVSAIARALSAEDPVDVDGSLVLYGREGVGKDRFFGLLFGDFLASLPSNKPIGHADCIQVLSTSWAIHDAEMAACRLANRGTDDDPLSGVKAVISQRVDSLRLPYGRTVETRYRRGVFVFSTNRRELVPVGDAGRRFWPIEAVRLDEGSLERDREQIWAEALALYNRGEAWWIDQASDEGATVANLRAAYTDTDPWTDDIAAKLPEIVQDAGAQWRVSSRALLHTLGLDASKRDVSAMRRLKRLMGALGWECSGHSRYLVSCPETGHGSGHEKNVFYKQK